MIGWAFIAVTWAGEPTSWINDRGGISGTVSLAMSIADAQKFLSDPVRLSRIEGGGTRVVLVATEGVCSVFDYTSPSVMSDIQYRVRQCPQSDGVELKLVQSNTFSSYRARWTISPEGTGTLARYDLDMVVSVLVPDVLLQQTSKRAVYQMLDRILAYTVANP